MGKDDKDKIIRPFRKDMLSARPLLLKVSIVERLSVSQVNSAMCNVLPVCKQMNNLRWRMHA